MGAFSASDHPSENAGTHSSDPDDSGLDGVAVEVWAEQFDPAADEVLVGEVPRRRSGAHVERPKLMSAPAGALAKVGEALTLAFEEMGDLARVATMEPMNGDLIMRRAEVRDVHSIVRCVHRAYEPYVARMDRRPAPMLADYGQLVEDGLVIVAERNGSIEGLIVVWAEADHVYIDNIATVESSRGTGVGQALLAWAEDHARAIGHAEIRLYTNIAMVENLGYYERRGFVETHRSGDSGYERAYFSKSVSTA